MSRDYKDAIKEETINIGKSEDVQSTNAADFHSQIVDSPRVGTDKKEIVKSLYILLITHTNQLTRIRETLHDILKERSTAIDKAIKQFEIVVIDEKKFAENLQRELAKRASSFTDDTNTSNTPATGT